MKYDGIRIILDQSLSQDVDIPFYVKKLRTQYRNQDLERISFASQDKALLLRYRFKNNPFECILRISTEDLSNRPAV